MKLFCFASRNLENIWLGLRAKLWAVATVSDSAMRGCITKAERYFLPGVRGLLYCNPTQSFTTPFVATSKADPSAVVSDVWPEPWVLPFSIEPLGDPRHQLFKDDAVARWSLHIERLRHYPSISAALNIAGTTVFVPTNISEDAWRMILDDLEIDPEWS